MPFIDGDEIGQERRERLDMVLEPLIDELGRASKIEAELEYCFTQMILQTHKLGFTSLNPAFGTLLTTALCLYMTVLGPYEMHKLMYAWLSDRIVTQRPGRSKGPKKEDREQK